MSRLSGRILVGRESLDDTEYPVTAQVEQVLQDKFSNKLDRDFIGGTGPHPVPTGILAVAAEVAGADLELAAVKAKAQIGTTGGLADPSPCRPRLIGELESARDEIGRPLYPEGVGAVRRAGHGPGSRRDPGALSSTPPVCGWSINRDFVAEMTPYTDEAWSRYAESLRDRGQVRLLAAPMAQVKSVPKRRRSPRPRALGLPASGDRQPTTLGTPAGPSRAWRAPPGPGHQPPVRSASAPCRAHTGRAALACQPQPRLAADPGPPREPLVTASPPPWESWAPPLSPPAANGLPLTLAQAIADAWWATDPHLCAALQWEAYAATLPMTPTVSQVATGAQSVMHSPAQPAGDYGLALARAAWHRSFTTAVPVPLEVRRPVRGR